jgi:hypothetical protein
MMNQHVFDEVIGEPPSSTVDVAGIVRKERRARFARRCGGAAVAAVAVLAVAAGLLTGAQHGPERVDAAPPDATFKLVLDSRESAQATAERLSAALDEAVKDAAPGAQWLAGNAYGVPTRDGQAPPIFTGDGVRTSDQVFAGGGSLEVDGRRGALALEIMEAPVCHGSSGSTCRMPDTWRQKTAKLQQQCRELNQPNCKKIGNPDRMRQLYEEMFNCQGAPGCTERVGPNGKKIIVRIESTRPPTATGPGQLTSYHVRTELPEGHVLELSVGNMVEKEKKDTSLPQQDPPLTVDQVVSVLTAVSSKIKP